jgi:hypothetical protein
MIRHLTLASLFALSLLASGCGSSGGSSGTLTVPVVASLVQQSLPAGLKPGGTSPVVAVELRHAAELDRAALNAGGAHAFTNTATNVNATLAAGYLINLFQDTFSGTQGYLMQQVSTIDSRMSLFQGVAISGCLAQTPVAFPIDLSAIDSTLKFTLKEMQCYAPFNSSNANAQSGEAFGQSGTTTSVWVQVADTFSTGGGFMNYANVENAGSTSAAAPETVDGVSFGFGPNTGTGTGSASGFPIGGNMQITRFIATPTTNTFEMYYGSNAGVIQSASSTDISMIGAGFRMISNGTLIYADGTLCTDPGGTTCNGNSGNWQAFNVCLDGATIAVHSPASDCNALSNLFTLNNTSATTLNFQAVTGDSMSNVDLSYGNMGNQIGPSTTVVNLVVPFGNINQFTSVLGKYGP